MPRWVSIPLWLGGGWIVMTMLGISIHPSQMEAADACFASFSKTLWRDGKSYFCNHEEGQIMLMVDGKVTRRYFHF
jgi:hypothetical protein